MIAIALAGSPRLLIADEPTTALDVTIQAQVLDLLDDLRHTQDMALLLITHDLGVVARMADRIGVMYAGQLVEEAPRSNFSRSRRTPIRCACSPRCPMPNGAAAGWRRFPAACRRRKSGMSAAALPTAAAKSWRSAAHRRRPGARSSRASACAASCRARRRPLPQKSAPATRQRRFADDSRPLLEVSDLQVHFPIRRGMLQRAVGAVRAVDGMSLQLMPGRTLALVGESGCGKTTAGKAMLQLLRPTAGSVQLDGVELTTRSASELRPLRAKMQMVFQDPFASLNPRLRIGEIIAEGMLALGTGGMGGSTGDAISPARVGRAAGAGRPARRHGGPLPARVFRRPAPAHRHRARAGGQPQLLICDEPTSALDVSVQAQILNLLSDLQRDLKLAYLFITHNIAVVDYLAHDVAVMYLGRVVESGSADEVLRSPRHPYTQALLAAVPRVDGAMGEAPKLAGDMPSPANPPSGCHFHPRCPLADADCRRDYPAARRFGATQFVRCIKA
jgi:peptide/nickel transport system ATP-binding protein